MSPEAENHTNLERYITEDSIAHILRHTRTFDLCHLHVYLSVLLKAGPHLVPGDHLFLFVVDEGFKHGGLLYPRLVLDDDDGGNSVFLLYSDLCKDFCYSSKLSRLKAGDFKNF